MKLLSSIQAKTKRESLTAVLEAKSTTLDEAIVSKKNEVLSLEEKFVRVMEEQRLIRAKEEQDWQERNTALRKETEELEKRKKEALVPLLQKEKELEDRDEVLSQREQEVSEKQQHNNELSDALETKLDEASDRLESVKQREEAVKRKEEGSKLQEEYTNKRTEQLNEVLTKSLASIEQARNELAEQKALQDGREKILKEKEARLTKKEKELVSRERALTDKYRTLERSTEEFKKKQNVT